VSVRLVSLANPEAWERALSRIPHGPAHTHWYNAALSLSVEDELALVEYVGDRCAAVCPLILRRHGESIDIASPYGFGGFAIDGDCKGLPGEFRRFACGQGWICGYLTIHPLSSHSFAPADGLEAGRTVYLLDLTAAESFLLASMHPTHRYEIRKAEQLLSAVVTAPHLIADALPGLYAETRARVGASETYRFSRSTLHAWLASPGCLALGLGDPLQAVVICLYTRDVADYFLNASTLQGRKYTRILVWAAVQELKRRGIRCFNLGGGVREGDQLDDFKRRFGGRAVAMPVLKQVYCREQFEVLCLQTATAGERPGGYFPPYRQ
jgi:hypothetical protein